jgi:DNA-binding transcriptional regulator YdaS (Cro superfamily)
MKKEQVLNYFGGPTGVARALGISQPSVTNWSDPIPALRQLEIERLTAGALRADSSCDKFRPAPATPQPAARVPRQRAARTA